MEDQFNVVHQICLTLDRILPYKEPKYSLHISTLLYPIGQHWTLYPPTPLPYLCSNQFYPFSIHVVLIFLWALTGIKHPSRIHHDGISPTAGTWYELPGDVVAIGLGRIQAKGRAEITQGLSGSRLLSYTPSP